MIETPGLLDGFSIIRFAHISGQGGGVETYLNQLNRILLMRNRMTIIHLFPGKGQNDCNESIEKIGQGEFLQIAIPDFGQAITDKGNTIWQWQFLEKCGFKQLIRNLIVYNPILYQVLFKTYLLKRKKPFIFGEAVGADIVTTQEIAKHSVDCVILHSATGRDSFDVARACKGANIPYIIANHFENSRFRYISMRELSNEAACVAGVSNIGVPSYFRKRYVNLSDGIDTSFFCLENARELNNGPSEKFILLVARIYPDKGHIPLIKALSRLRQQGFGSINAVFAGRCDDAGFKEKLSLMIAQRGLEDCIFFSGLLEPEELRNWYAASSLVVLPSMSEGLPRTLIEAQSMGRPVVAFDSGGIAEAFIDGKTGFLVRKGDIKCLADRIALLLKDEKLRTLMGKEGRAFIEKKFSLEALAERHERCYLSVINKWKAF